MRRAEVLRTVAMALTCSLAAGSVASFAETADAFDDVFIDKTMRVDYFHTHDHGAEVVALDRVVSDGPWAGSRTRLIDDLNLGTYLFAIYDLSTNRMIYSRGFSSIYAEWVTVPASRTTAETFHESLRFPWPKRPVKVVLESRDDRNHFRPVWSTTVDPSSRFVNPADPAPRGELWTVLDNGPPSEKVDLLLLGDGYAEADRDKFRSQVRHFVDVLFTFEPFKSRKGDFNVRAIDLASEKSGVSRPRAASFHRTPLSVEYNIFDSERYALTRDNRALREVASGAPYEYIEILINEDQYGGGGMFRDQATVSAGSGSADYVFVHEFGHHFAGLADEYYTSEVSYETGIANLPEPWEPNATALADPENLKWGDLLDSGIAIPTPWDQAEYDEKSLAFQEQRRELRAQNVPESRIDDYFAEVKRWSSGFLGSQEHSGAVGAFRGASYEATSLYRPELDCVMFTRDDVGFCRVCQRAIHRVIDFYSKH